MMHSDKNTAGHEGEESPRWSQEVLNLIEKKEKNYYEYCNCNCWWSRK